MKKYQKVYREMYEQWYRENQAYREQVAADENRLAYHLMPETGWLNDPNGLCQVNGVYHIYYQYTPFEPTGELKLWGHCTTQDFVHYRQCEPAVYPDQDFDAHGVYSGSAFVENGLIHYFYTGNVKLQDKDYDYILEGREQNTIHLVSEDGVHAGEKQLVMTNADYPADMSKHVRDPKIFAKNGRYYMVQGARDCESKGCVLLFESEDLMTWKYFDRIAPEEKFGYMWECPDLFEVDGQEILIACPQGVPKSGHDYQNVYQCGYFPIEMDFENKKYKLGEFHELDKGFDIYATQTFLDENGRRILIGWMGIPDADYDNDATVEYDWIHALTMPRVLTYQDGKLIQKPLEELKSLRKNKMVTSITSFGEWTFIPHS